LRESERDADGLLVIDNYLSRDEIGRIIGRNVFLEDLKHLHHRDEYFLDSKQEEIVRPRSRRRPKTNEKKGEQIMVVCAWIVLQDVERRKNGCLKFQENSNPKPKGLGTCKQCKIKEGSVYTNIHSI
jgi:hypothetical protein